MKKNTALYLETEIIEECKRQNINMSRIINNILGQELQLKSISKEENKINELKIKNIKLLNSFHELMELKKKLEKENRELKKNMYKYQNKIMKLKNKINDQELEITKLKEKLKNKGGGLDINGFIKPF